MRGGSVALLVKVKAWLLGLGGGVGFESVLKGPVNDGKVPVKEDS